MLEAGADTLLLTLLWLKLHHTTCWDAQGCRQRNSTSAFATRSITPSCASALWGSYAAVKLRSNADPRPRPLCWMLQLRSQGPPGCCLPGAEGSAHGARRLPPAGGGTAGTALCWGEGLGWENSPRFYISERLQFGSCGLFCFIWFLFFYYLFVLFPLLLCFIQSCHHLPNQKIKKKNNLKKSPLQKTCW